MGEWEPSGKRGLVFGASYKSRESARSEREWPEFEGNRSFGCRESKKVSLRRGRNEGKHARLAAAAKQIQVFTLARHFLCKLLVV